METIATIGVLGAIGGLSAFSWWKFKKYEAMRQFWQRLIDSGAIFVSPPWSGLRIQIATPADGAGWQSALLLISDKRIAIYPDHPTEHPEPLLTVDVHDLRGFWRPEPYTNGRNEIWLHCYNKRWIVLKVQVYRSTMQEIVRALKQVAPPEQVTAYRRRRPYIHLGPEYAQPARQSLQGDWQLEDPVELYLMPAALVAIERDGLVRAYYPLAEMQNIAALKRMEGGSLPGLIRFRYQGQMIAFAVHDWENWASSLAEAAKRTLEAPIIRKSKSKPYDDDDDE